MKPTKRHEPPLPRIRCAAIAKSGKPCPAYALPDAAHCSNHDPKQAARRREMGAIRKPKPVDPAALSDPDAIAQRPRTLQGVADTAWDHIARVRAGEVRAIGTAELVFKGLKVALDAHKAIEEGKKVRRGAGPVVTPDASASGNSPSASAPAQAVQAVDVLAEMVAARQRETVQ